MELGRPVLRGRTLISEEWIGTKQNNGICPPGRKNSMGQDPQPSVQRPGGVECPKGVVRCDRRGRQVSNQEKQ